MKLSTVFILLILAGVGIFTFTDGINRASLTGTGESYEVGCSNPTECENLFGEEFTGYCENNRCYVVPYERGVVIG